MVNAILWVLNTGARWRDLPRKYGNWKTVYSRFRRWSQRGVWDDLLSELGQTADEQEMIIDATIMRVHQDGTGAKKGVKNSSARVVAG